MKKVLPIQQTLTLLLLLVSCNLWGQKIDSTFTSPFTQRASFIYKVLQQPDGKILLAGDISYYDSKSVGRLIRLNPDGSIDKSLQAALPADFIPVKMELMSSGNILVYDFSRIFKLGPNGRLKNQITIPSLSSVNPLPNDKFMVTTWSGGLYRYKADLTIDTTFPGQDHFADGSITDLEIQGNKLVICGPFANVNGIPKNDVARLFLNGTVDTAFDTGVGTNDYLSGIEINPVDGKIYFSGGSRISSFGGLSFFGMARLKSNGVIDSLFYPTTYDVSTNVYFTTDNKIISSGSNGIVRINNDGTVDNTFTKIQDGTNTFQAFQRLSDGTLLAASLRRIGGDFGIAKFSADGIKIPAFNPPVARAGIISSMDRINQKLIVAGEFFMLNKHHTYNVGKLNANGSVDTNFKALNNDGAAYQCTVLPDGKILVSSFYDFSRLNANGTLDSTFQFSPFKSLYQVEAFRVLSDGKIFAAGPNGVNKLNSNGSEDTTFDEGSGFCCGASAFGMGVQSTGKVLYAGFFSQYNGTPISKILRLNTNATIDATFNIGTGPNNQITRMEVLANDQLLLGGWFNDFNGNATPGGLVRLKKDGLLDTTFHAAFAPFTPFLDIKKFGQKILVSTYLGGKYSIAAINYDNGAAAPDFTVPVEIVPFNNRIALYVQNSSTFYVLGNVNIVGQSKPSSITKINYTPVVPAALARVASTATEVSSESAVRFQVYPNPSQREIIFDVTQTYDLRIVKYTGEVVMETSINASKNTVDISTLKPDTYIIQLGSGKKRQTSILIKN